MFVNVEAGEKLVYLHYIVNELIQHAYIPGYINYDIACRAAPYLRKFESALLDEISKHGVPCTKTGATYVAGIMFAIGRWHAYGHQSSCHSVWNMLFQAGFGLTDGEDMERLWAVLNDYAGSTSQMTLGNRNDSLSLVLHYIGDMKTREQPHKLLLVRLHTYVLLVHMSVHFV